MRQILTFQLHMRLLAILLCCGCSRAAVFRGSSEPGAAPPGLTSQPGVPAEIKGKTSVASQAKSSPKIQPQLFFLFLVYVKINNEAVWERFFAPAVRGVDYVALVHCKSEAGCENSIRSKHVFEIIPSVETTYCTNLVSGMNALLRAALNWGGAGSPNDKFLFVSDSTLPVKPFHIMQQRMTADANSDFCVFPRNEWAEVQTNWMASKWAAGVPAAQDKVTKVAVKHHQWITLGREHATLVMRHAHERQDIMKEFQLNMGFHNTGCLDEFWYFATIYDSLNLTGRPSELHLQSFNGGALKTNDYEVQGQCDTFVHWVPRAAGVANEMTKLAHSMMSDYGTDMTPASESRPASIQRFSKASVKQLRDSSFLFARKVDDGVIFSGCESIDEAFDALVFSTPGRSLSTNDAVWRGQGTWLDNRHSPVTIASLDGSLTLQGRDGLKARGSYCHDRVDLTFMNGYKGQARLSDDGFQLSWSNGVTWQRTLDQQAM